jgi:predicted ferric reductase
MVGKISEKEIKIIKYSTILVLTLITALTIYPVLSSFGSNLSGIFYSLGRLFGILGFLVISILIISGDTARFFDRIFGIDRIIKFQRKFAILTYFVVFSHPIFFILSFNGYIKSIIPDFSVIPLALGTLALYLFIGVMISSLLYKRISHKIWQYIHILTYILFALIWYHSFQIGSSLSFLPIKIIYFVLPILVAIGLIYRASYKIKQRENRFFLKEKIKETGDTYTFIIKSEKELSFNAGQFFFLRLEGKGLYARHPFSVSNAPNKKELHFTIKKAGKFTEEMFSLKKGDEIKIEGPFGNFILGNENDVVFIAGGVGITPFMSMINENKNNKSPRKILLLYGSKTEKDIIFKKQLDSIKGNWLKKFYVLSQEKNKGYEFGRIDESILSKHISKFADKSFYLCGPSAMMSSVIKILKEKGVPKDKIFFEDFFW